MFLGKSRYALVLGLNWAAWLIVIVIDQDVDLCTI